MKISYKSVLMLLIFLFLYFIMATPGVTKYIIIIVLSVFFVILNKRYRINNRTLIYMLPSLVYIFWGLVAGLMKGSFSFYGIKQAVFYLVPVCAAILIYNKVGNKLSKKIVDIQLIAIAIVFLLDNFSKFTIEDLMESEYAFIFGIYVILYVYQKKYTKTVFTAVLMVLSHKRIVNGATIVCVLLIIIFNRLNEGKKKKLLSLFSLLVLLMLYGYIYLSSSTFIHQIFGKYGINTQGRLEVWDTLTSYYKFNVFYGGNGIGWILNYLAGIQRTAFSNLHNDLLSAYIELGFMGYGVWISSYYHVLKRTRMKIAGDQYIIGLFFLYTFIIYATDNISIYVNYWFPLYLIILSLADYNGNNEFQVKYSINKSNDGSAKNSMETAQNNEVM